MMAKLTDAAKAVLMFDFEGREYRLSPLDYKDLGELERWVETLPYERARRKLEALGDMATPEMKKQIIADAEAIAQTSGIESETYVRAIATLTGTAYCLYLCLRHEHPDITRDIAASIVTIDKLVEWQERIDRVSGLSPTEDEVRPTDGADSQTPPSTTP